MSENQQQEDNLFPEDEHVEIMSLDDIEEEEDEENDADASLHHHSHTYHPQPFDQRIPFTPRQLRIAMRVSLVASLLLLLTMVWPNSVSVIQSFAQEAIGPVVPTPNNSPMPTYGNIYLDTAVPWTQATLDGQHVALPTIAPLRLNKGQHQLMWNAQPFLPQSCKFSIPHSANDTCFIASTQVQRHSNEQGQGLLRAYNVEVIQLSESLHALPIEQQATLANAIQEQLAHLTMSETIQKGEQYTGEYSVITATQPLRATLHFQLSTDDQYCQNSGNMLADYGLVCNIDGQDCEQLCTTPWHWRFTSGQISPTADWFSLAMITPYWDYTTIDGRMLARNQPYYGDGLSLRQQLVLLRISWTDTWHIAVLVGSDMGPPMYVRMPTNQGVLSSGETVQLATDPACTPARIYIASGLTPSQQDDGSRYVSARLISAPNLARGCLVVVNSGPAAPQNQVAYYIVRFGILSAASPIAHFLRPELPQATAYEQSIVKQLAELPGQEVIAKVGY